MSDSVGGNLTLRLINVPWDQALDIILRAKSLDKRKDGNVVWVAPQKELSDYEQAREDARIGLELRAETITEYIPVNYGNAADLAELLTDAKRASGGGGGGGGAGGGGARGILSARGSVTSDQRTNTLIVTDIPKKIEEVKQLLALLDRPVDQVLIEARVVVADENFARDLGARFGLSDTHTNANGNTTTSGFDINLPIGGAAGVFNLSILRNSSQVDLELSALETEGRGEILSNPRVITSNQREAIIKQGDEIGYVTTTNNNNGQTQQAQFKEALLELKVTPTITQDGRVYLTLAIKKDDVKSIEAGGVPSLSRREVSTAVLVDNGNTVVIGGVYEFKTRDDVNKVPWLGDVPFLGNLFKKRERGHTKAELLIFVTPRVLQTSRR